MGKNCQFAEHKDNHIGDIGGSSERRQQENDVRESLLGHVNIPNSVVKTNHKAGVTSGKDNVGKRVTTPGQQEDSDSDVMKCLMGEGGE